MDCVIQKDMGTDTILDTNGRFNIDPNQPKPTKVIYWKDPDIDQILVFCGDGDYIIRIDQLRNGQVRYLCWLASKGILSKPSLILHGIAEKDPNGDKTEYIFTYGEWTYSLEHIVVEGKPTASHIFLEVADQEHKKSTWKMEELPLPKYLR